jgi:indole-3-glycerol phosphate synthase
MSILEEIFAHKRLEVQAARRERPRSELEAALRGLPPALGFSDALRAGSGSAPRLIAEVKHRSPSKGVLRPDFDPLALARAYAGNGAAAISVLTDEKYFGGSLDTLRGIARLDLGLPLLRKDFILDRYQLLEARLAGASAVLLIAAMLAPGQLRHLLAAAHGLGLEALVEAHDRQEVEKALEAGAALIGVNNRDLHTFTVSLETCLALRPLIPPEALMVAESGIHTLDDVARLAAAGVEAMLVGEALVTAPDAAAKVRDLTGLPAADRTLHSAQ